MASRYARNLPLFFLSQALYQCMLFLPTWVIFLQRSHGLSLTQVTLVDLAFWLTMALTEVPTGAVADTLGRKASLLIGTLLCIGSVLLFALAPTFALLMLANSLWGIAMTFLSGADLALFYDTLRELGRTAEYTRLRGLLTSVTLTAGALGNILGGVLAVNNLVTPFLAYAGLLLLTLLVQLGLVEPPRETQPGASHPPGFVATLRLAVAAVRDNPALRYTILYANLLPLANLAITVTFIQPHMQQIGLPLAAFGLVTFGFSLVRIAAASSAGWLVERLGQRRLLLLAPLLVTLGLAGLAGLPGLASLAALGAGLFAAGAARPLLEQIILEHAPGMARASVLSIDNLVFRLLLAGIEPGGGLVGDLLGLRAAFWLFALGTGLVLAWVLPGLLRTIRVEPVR